MFGVGQHRFGLPDSFEGFCGHVLEVIFGRSKGANLNPGLVVLEHRNGNSRRIGICSELAEIGFASAMPTVATVVFISAPNIGLKVALIMALFNHTES